MLAFQISVQKKEDRLMMRVVDGIAFLKEYYLNYWKTDKPKKTDKQIEKFNKRVENVYWLAEKLSGSEIYYGMNVKANALALNYAIKRNDFGMAGKDAKIPDFECDKILAGHYSNYLRVCENAGVIKRNRKRYELKDVQSADNLATLLDCLDWKGHMTKPYYIPIASSEEYNNILNALYRLDVDVNNVKETRVNNKRRVTLPMASVGGFGSKVESGVLSGSDAPDGIPLKVEYRLVKDESIKGGVNYNNKNSEKLKRPRGGAGDGTDGFICPFGH